MDKERIKMQVYLTKLVAADALGNNVIGDCPTRTYEGLAEIEAATDKLLSVLAEEGVIELDEKESKKDRRINE